MASSGSSIPAFAEIWVSCDGNDSASGTREAPFRTLARAHESLCRFAEGASGAGAIAVVLGDGTHRLEAPLVFDSRRFGVGGPQVRFGPAPGARPTISGAIPVEGWTLHDEALNIYKANVGTHRSRQLVVNGQRATRARTTMSDGGLPAAFLPKPVLPPNPSADAPYVIGGGIEFVPTPLNPERWRDPARWTNPRDIEAVIKTQWKMMSVPLCEIATSSASNNGTIFLQQPAWTNANIYFDPGSGAPGIWSMWQVTYFENAYEFLDQPGEWYLNHATGDIFYIPRPGEDLTTADVELPIVEVLIEAIGTAERPVANLKFEGITFRCATWLGPGGADGYVADQSGFCAAGDRHRPNVVGHVEHVVRTPGNLRFEYAHDIVFERSSFQHLGAVALDFGTGSQRNRIVDNRFEDIASAAIQLGGVDTVDHHPQRPEQCTADNVISNNWIARTGRDYVDSAAIYVGFTRNTLVSHNTIRECPWTGIALGWGWGLFDPGSIVGLPGGSLNMWGVYTTLTSNSGNRVIHNHISHFLQELWDGGAIYFNGRQGPSMSDPLLIEGNVACRKRKEAGGNIFYSDANSRYVVFRNNALFENPIGHVDYGPPPRPGDPLPYQSSPSSLNAMPYGGDIGGCRAYGEMLYEGNYWRAGWIPLEEAVIDAAESMITGFLWGRSFDTYSKEGFFNICPYDSNGVSYPTGLRFSDNHDIPLGELQVPQEILRNAGVQQPGPTPDLQLAACGASFPPRNSGPSWNVPRVSMPGLFGLQPQYTQEWWYYVGTAYDENGNAFGLQIQISRVGSGALQAGMGITGIGWRDGERSHYLSGLGFGLGAGESAATLPSVVIPPVSDDSYFANFVPLLEIVGRSPNPLEDLVLNLPSADGWDGWRFEYLAGASAGQPVGEPGSVYSIAARGRGYQTTADSAEITAAEYRIELTVQDQRGTVMEGICGYVGPAMFATNGEGAPSSYECAQPHLQIQSGGTIAIDGKSVTIESGYLWLDRQMVAGSPSGAGAAAAPTDAESLKRAIAETSPRPKPLYVGDWMGIVLNDGKVVVVAEFWQKSTPQWITGTGTGKPPLNGFGNLYFDIRGTTPPFNGGVGLRARNVNAGPWDFDVNILDPNNPASSPHWQSPLSGKTYATAWQIDFAPEFAAAHTLPPALYVFAISDNCEIMTIDKEGAFFEGAALIYADKEKTRFLGHAFVEQMGFD